MTPASILRGALALLSDPRNWTQGAYARDRRGASVRPESAEACCWCLGGALLRQSHDTTVDAALSIADRAAQQMAGSGYTVAVFNDGPFRRHSEVVELLRRALALAESEEKDYRMNEVRLFLLRRRGVIVGAISAAHARVAAYKHYKDVAWLEDSQSTCEELLTVPGVRYTL